MVLEQAEFVKMSEKLARRTGPGRGRIVHGWVMQVNNIRCGACFACISVIARYSVHSKILLPYIAFVLKKQLILGKVQL